jgi:hypothetical protein
MSNRISMLISLLLLVWGCGDLKGNARRDTEATLGRLRTAGLKAHIEITQDDAVENLRQLRLGAKQDAILIVISGSRIAIDLPDSLSHRLGELRQSRLLVWSTPYLNQNDPEGAARAAARGLLVDLMNAGVIPPSPVSPLLLMNSDAARAPSNHGMSGALIVVSVVFLGVYLARRGQMATKSTYPSGGVG